MYVTPGNDPPWRFCESSPYARPIVALAWLYGPSAPRPLFIRISLRIGPLTTTIAAIDDVLLIRAEYPLDARARMTGKYAGSAPAITAFTAAFSTVNSHSSR